MIRENRVTCDALVGVIMVRSILILYNVENGLVSTVSGPQVEPGGVLSREKTFQYTRAVLIVRETVQVAFTQIRAISAAKYAKHEVVLGGRSGPGNKPERYRTHVNSESLQGRHLVYLLWEMWNECACSGSRATSLYFEA